MPSYTWTGAIDGVFTKTGNWIDDATGVASVVALANNDTLQVMTGNVNIVAEVVTLTGLTIIVGEKYTGTIAPGGTLDVNASVLKHYGHAANYSGTMGSVIIQAQGEAKVNFNPGSTEVITSLVAIDSNVDIGSDCRVTTLRMDGNKTVNAAYNSTGFTDAFVDGGTLNTYRDGRFRVKGKVNTEGTLAKPLTGTVVDAGGVLHHKTAVDFATSCEIEVRRSGTFHATESKASFAAKTVNRWPGSIADYQTQGDPATYTEATYGRSSNVGGFVPL